MKSIYLFLLFISYTYLNAQLSSVTDFTIPTLAIGDTIKELGKDVQFVFQDSRQNYWYGTKDNGVYRMNGALIVHFTITEGLVSNRIWEIKEDQLGNIYLSSDIGISQFNGLSFQTLNERIGLDLDWQLQPNDIWFKCPSYDGFVYRFDGTDLIKLKLPKIELGEAFIAKYPSVSPYGVYCIYTDSHGNLWYGTAALGALRYNGNAFDWILEEDLTELHDGPANGVRSIIEDKNGDFWFNSAYRYTIDYTNVNSSTKRCKSKFYKRTKSIGSLDGSNNDAFTEYLSVTIDSNKHLWFVTYNDGVWKYDGAKISHFPVQINGQNIHLFAIYCDKNGGLWLRSHEHGLFKFNGEVFE